MKTRYLLVLSGLSCLCSSTGYARDDPARILPFEPPKCPADTDDYAAWLPATNLLEGDRKTVPEGDIFEVPEGRKAAAISLLSKEAFVRLSPEQSSDFTGGEANGRAQRGQAFLIRNVVPDFLALLKAGPARLERIGTGIQISAGLFGCGGFKKNPLVVYLPSAPSEIDMRVGAIW